MPAGFDRCAKSGGRIRTKNLGNGKYMRICFLNGKSYPGHVATKEEFKDKTKLRGGESVKDKNKMKKDYEKFTESLSFTIQEGTVDEDKRTVRVCALAPCLSKNNRYYSPSVVESASGSLMGKKSFADHDQRDTTKLIGRIVGEEYVDGKLYADIKVSKAKGIASQTWSKITDGTITDVSIAADGKTKRVKIGGKYGEEVTELSIKSVDFVTEGGVSAAKVVKVFEGKDDLPDVSEVKKEMIESLEQLREEYPDFVSQIEEGLKSDLEKARKENEDLKYKLNARELDDHKAKLIGKLETTEKIKDILRKRVGGKSKEELGANLESEFEYIKSIEVATTREAKVEDVPEAKQEEKKELPWTSRRIMEDSKIPDDLKIRCCEMLVAEGSKVMLEFLEGREIKL